MTRRVAIDQLRITGIAGRAPTRAEIEAALARALADRTAGAAPKAASIRDGRIALPTGATLADAARAVAAAVRK